MSDSGNPYQPPQAPILPPPISGVSPYAPCPKCGSKTAELMKFTWWGGVLGPKMLTHVKCGGCGQKYNGKTGAYNTAAIWLYQIIAIVIFAVLGFVFFRGLR